MKVPISETRSAISRLRNVGTRRGRPRPADSRTSLSVLLNRVHLHSSAGNKQRQGYPAEKRTLAPISWQSPDTDRQFDRRECAARTSIYARFLKDSRRTFEPTSGHRSEHKPADVRQISHTARLHLRDSSRMQQLGEEPKTNQERRRDECDPEEYKNEQYRFNSIARIVTMNAPITAAMAPLAPRFGMEERGSATIWASMATTPPSR